jgi:hypothetical protein
VITVRTEPDRLGPFSQPLQSEDWREGSRHLGGQSCGTRSETLGEDEDSSAEVPVFDHRGETDRWNDL